jgi:hypothetical protein
MIRNIVMGKNSEVGTPAGCSFHRSDDGTPVGIQVVLNIWDKKAMDAVLSGYVDFEIKAAE